VGGVGLERGAGSPGKAAGVGDAVGQRLNGHHIGAGTAQEHQRDRPGGSGIPCDCVRLASRDQFVQAGLEDGISRGVLGVVGLGRGHGESRQAGDDRRNGETHFIRNRRKDCKMVLLE
jgi:hypothetical protein